MRQERKLNDGFDGALFDIFASTVMEAALWEFVYVIGEWVTFVTKELGFGLGVFKKSNMRITRYKNVKSCFILNFLKQARLHFLVLPENLRLR